MTTERITHHPRTIAARGDGREGGAWGCAKGVGRGVANAGPREQAEAMDGRSRPRARGRRGQGLAEPTDDRNRDPPPHPTFGRFWVLPHPTIGRLPHPTF